MPGIQKTSHTAPSAAPGFHWSRGARVQGQGYIWTLHRNGPSE